MVSGEQVLHLFLNRRPAKLLKDDGILMPQMQFSESLEFRGVRGGVFGSQNRIFLNRRPHENLKDDGIYYYLEAKGLFFCQNRRTFRVLLKTF